MFKIAEELLKAWERMVNSEGRGYGLSTKSLKGTDQHFQQCYRKHIKRSTCV